MRSSLHPSCALPRFIVFCSRKLIQKILGCPTTRRLTSRSSLLLASKRRCWKPLKSRTVIDIAPKTHGRRSSKDATTHRRPSQSSWIHQSLTWWLGSTLIASDLSVAGIAKIYTTGELAKVKKSRCWDFHPKLTRSLTTWLPPMLTDKLAGV